MKTIVSFIFALFLCGICANNLIVSLSVIFFCSVAFYGVFRIYGAKKIYKEFYGILCKILND